MLEMLIIGGGIHGVHLAHCLLQQTQMTHDDIRILDPHDELLHEWRRCTRNCGMKYLRSSSVHHIDTHPFSLRRYAALPENRKITNFISPKNRPSVELFDAHCRMVIDDHQLDSLHIQGRVLELQHKAQYVSIVTADETINARYVLLAIGMSEQPQWPDWAVRLREKGVSVSHVFDPNFCLDGYQNDGPVVVIGGGISGGHIALRMTEQLNADVLLISRKKISISNFDFAPGWIGPRYTEGFYRSPIEQRRQQIVEARAKGSVPKDMKLELDKAVSLNKLTIISDDITETQCQNGDTLLIGRRGRYQCQRVILATGFMEKCPNGGFVNQAINEFNLKTAACGFPVITPSLQWHDRIFVTGPLSELQIGPVARNIVGARHSSSKITAAFKKKLVT
ncbi:NAD(P)-binding domain-containing protein [Desulforhopalus sp. 52FAK]